MADKDFFINFKMLFSPLKKKNNISLLKEIQKIHDKIEKFDEKVLKKRINIIYLENLKEKWQTSIKNMEEKNIIQQIENEKKLMLHNAIENNLQMQEKLITTLTKADLNMKKYYNFKHKIEMENLENTLSNIRNLSIAINKATGKDYSEKIEELKLEIDTMQKKYDEITMKIEKERQLDEKFIHLDGIIQDKIVSILRTENEIKKIDAEIANIDNEMQKFNGQIGVKKGKITNFEVDAEKENPELQNKFLEYLNCLESLRATPTLDDIPEFNNNVRSKSNIVTTTTCHRVEENKQSEFISELDQINMNSQIIEASNIDSIQKSSNIFESNEVNEPPKIIIHENIRIKSPVYTLLKENYSENDIEKITPYQKVKKSFTGNLSQSDDKISSKIDCKSSINSLSQFDDKISSKISCKSLKRKSSQLSSVTDPKILIKKKIKTSSTKYEHKQPTITNESTDDVLNKSKSQLLSKKIKDNNNSGKSSIKKNLRFNLNTTSIDNEKSYMTDNNDDNDINIDEFKIFCTETTKKDNKNDFSINLNVDNENDEISDFNMDTINMNSSSDKFADDKNDGIEMFHCDSVADFFTM